VKLAVVFGALLSAALSAACQDPCVQLAERICRCERSEAQRRVCRSDRIVQQQNNVTIDEADREFCAQKLDTCTCAALDQQDLDACGFVPVEGAASE
jgi:hypothetical protein